MSISFVETNTPNLLRQSSNCKQVSPPKHLKSGLILERQMKNNLQILD